MIRWYGLAAGVLLLDQATKWLAEDLLVYGRSVDVLPFLSWTLTCNTGAAFSMFQDLGWVFAIAAALVSGYLIVAIWRFTSGWLEGASNGLILAGALGNLADRLIRGCVVDFVHVHYGWFNFPVFNVADSAITIGAAGWILLIVLDVVRRRRADAGNGAQGGNGT